MNKFEPTTLDDFCSVSSGFAFKSEQFSENSNDTFLVKGSNLGHRVIRWDEGPWWDSSDYEKLQRYQLVADDVVLAMDRPIVGGQLKFAWIKKSDPKSLLVQRVACLRAKNVSDQIFLRYVIASPAFLQYIDTITTGVNVPHISGPDIRKYKFNLPLQEDRQKIAAILLSYDELIENNLERIKLLEEMAEITYQEWFLRKKFPGHEEVGFDPETGMPDGWAHRKLGDVVALHYGKALKAGDRNGGATPVYGSAGIVGYHDSSLVSGPGIVLGRKGNVGSVYWSHCPFYPIDTVYYVASKYSLYFIYYLLKHQEFINNDAAVPGLNRNAAYAKRVNLPTPELIEQFDRKVESTFSAINNLQQQVELLKEARDILLPRLMTGMIDIDKVELPEALLERIDRQNNNETNIG